EPALGRAARCRRAGSARHGSSGPDRCGRWVSGGRYRPPRGWSSPSSWSPSPSPAPPHEHRPGL
ncbi:MAG: hypothetical protein AVDCRST_MAG32-332, partial [uncultured Nocardioides sp.]